MANKSLLDPAFVKEWAINVFTALGDGLLIADKQEIIQYVNPEYLRIVNMRAEDVLGQPIAKVRPGAILPTVIRTGISMSGVYRKVGTVEYVVDMAPIRVDGEIIGGVSVVKDIAEVRKLSAELRKTQNSLKELQGTMEDIFKAHYTFADLIGSSPSFRNVVALAERVAVSNSNILLHGESGTGKELMAQAIHNASLRKDGHFVAVNCAAIPAALIESEMFGYAEGSFTGSKKGGKIGLFQLADGGTLFLDEIGDMNPELQAKILRVLQEQKVRPVGELKEKKIDIRIIAATNQDPEKMIEKGRFRQDLYYRLSVIQLDIPSLRERKPDVIMLASHFAEQYNRAVPATFSKEVKELLQGYDWPGNLRELKNVIEYACNMARDEQLISLHHMPERIRSTTKSSGDIVNKTMRLLDESIKEFEKETIKNAIRLYGDTLDGKRKACKALGISIATLYRKLSE